MNSYNSSRFMRVIYINFDVGMNLNSDQFNYVSMAVTDLAWDC